MTASQFVERFEAAVKADPQLGLVLPMIAAVKNGGASDQLIAETADRLARAYATARRVTLTYSPEIP